MFEKINELMDSLLKVQPEFSSIKNVREARKILQEIKVEAQNLRKSLTTEFKASKVK